MTGLMEAIESRFGINVDDSFSNISTGMVAGRLLNAEVVSREQFKTVCDDFGYGLRSYAISKESWEATKKTILGE